MSQDIVERLDEHARHAHDGLRAVPAADLREAVSLITTLTAERDAAWNEAQCCDDNPLGQSSLAEFIADQHACRKAAEALVQSMREALEPFAEAADSYDPDTNDGREAAWAHDFTIGSLRRARSALAQVKP